MLSRYEGIGHSYLTLCVGFHLSEGSSPLCGSCPGGWRMDMHTSPVCKKNKLEGTCRLSTPKTSVKADRLSTHVVDVGVPKLRQKTKLRRGIRIVFRKSHARLPEKQEERDLAVTGQCVPYPETFRIYLEITALVKRVGRSKDGYFPFVQVVVIDQADTKALHGLFRQPLQLLRQCLSTGWGGAPRRHSAPRVQTAQDRHESASHVRKATAEEEWSCLLFYRISLCWWASQKGYQE